MIKIELVIRHTQGLPDITCPIFVCDHCGKRIETIGQGLVSWKEDKTTSKPLDESISVYHNRPCSRIVEEDARQEGYTFPWWPMTWLLGYLVNNNGLSWSELVVKYCPPDQLAELKRTVREMKRSSENG